MNRRDPISANIYKNANILGGFTNWSAYAKENCELNYNNINYMHADILDLKKLNKKFDIIKARVLHHMDKPIGGSSATRYFTTTWIFEIRTIQKLQDKM